MAFIDYCPTPVTAHVLAINSTCTLPPSHRPPLPARGLLDAATFPILHLLRPSKGSVAGSNHAMRKANCVGHFVSSQVGPQKISRAMMRHIEPEESLVSFHRQVVQAFTPSVTLRSDNALLDFRCSLSPCSLSPGFLEGLLGSQFSIRSFRPAFCPPATASHLCCVLVRPDSEFVFVTKRKGSMFRWPQPTCSALPLRLLKLVVNGSLRKLCTPLG